MALRFFQRKVRQATRPLRYDEISNGNENDVSKKTRSEETDYKVTNRSPTHVEMINDVMPPALYHRADHDQEDDEIDEELEAEDFPITLVELMSDEQEQGMVVVSGKRTQATSNNDRNGNDESGWRSTATTMTSSETRIDYKQSSISYDGDESGCSVSKNIQDDVSLQAIRQRVVKFYSTDLLPIYSPRSTSTDVLKHQYISRTNDRHDDHLDKPRDNVERNKGDYSSRGDPSNGTTTTKNDPPLMDGVGEAWCGMMLWAANPGMFLEKHISLSSSIGSDDDDIDDEEDDNDEDDEEESIISNTEKHQSKRVFHQHHRVGSEAFAYISTEDVSALRGADDAVQNQEATRSGEASPLFMKPTIEYDIPSTSSKTRFLPILKTTMTEDATINDHNQPHLDDTHRWMRCCHQQICVVPEGFKSFDEAFYADKQPEEIVKDTSPVCIQPHGNDGGSDHGIVATTVTAGVQTNNTSKATETSEEGVIPKPRPLRGSSHDLTERTQGRDQSSVSCWGTMQSLAVDTNPKTATTVCSNAESPSMHFGSIANGCAFVPHASPRYSSGSNSPGIFQKEEDRGRTGNPTLFRQHNDDFVEGVQQRQRTVDDHIKDQHSSDEESALDYNYTSDTEFDDNLSEASDVLSIGSGFVAQNSEAENIPAFYKAEMHISSSPKSNKGIQAPSSLHVASPMSDTWITRGILEEKSLILHAEGSAIPDAPKHTPDQIKRNPNSPCINERPQWKKTNGHVRMDKDYLQQQSSPHEKDREDYAADWEPEPCVSDDESLIDYDYIEREIDQFVSNSIATGVRVSRYNDRRWNMIKNPK